MPNVNIFWISISETFRIVHSYSVIHANGCDEIAVHECVIFETYEQTCLTDTAVAYEHDLQANKSIFINATHKNISFNLATLFTDTHIHVKKVGNVAEIPIQ